MILNEWRAADFVRHLCGMHDHLNDVMDRINACWSIQVRNLYKSIQVSGMIQTPSRVSRLCSASAYHFQMEFWHRMRPIRRSSIPPPI